MRTTFGFKKIWVIESLPDGEYRTGKVLYDDVLFYKNLQNPNLLVEFVEVHNRKDVTTVLERITDNLRTTGHIPLLHFETHGNKDGMGLKNGDFIGHEELLPFLREINILTKHNLLVVVSACNGAYLTKILANSLTLPCPVWGICGPSESISAGDLVTGYSAFYNELLVPSNLNSAITKLRQSIPKHADKFSILNSEYLFMGAFDKYIQNMCTPDSVEKRTKAIIDATRTLSDNSVNFEQKEAKVRALLGTQEGQKQCYNFLKGKFFMHDRYPGEASLPDPPFEMAMKIRKDRQGRK